ncbi:unnamed protein product [Linum trigynum]|uniref:Integrase catalytic domain-containing protein n=1 Tax=Linum trigynum TaxID=586398 RepID=A0AAV2ERA0_9ROSI
MESKSYIPPPYYAQANGQAEASNKVVKEILSKMIEDNPRKCHEHLSEALWAYRMSPRSSTKVTPFALTYGHEAFLPVEVTDKSLRYMRQHELTSSEYYESMMLELCDLDEVQLKALDNIRVQKEKVSRAYNKRVKRKSFEEEELV